MKLIVALIQPYKLEDVKQALFDADVRKMTISTAMGCGQQGGFTETYRGVVTEVNLITKMRLEIAVNEDYVDHTIEAIKKGAHTGNIGDGKIFVMDLPRCVRIRTGEEGEEAIG